MCTNLSCREQFWIWKISNRQENIWTNTMILIYISHRCINNCVWQGVGVAGHCTQDLVSVLWSYGPPLTDEHFTTVLLLPQYTFLLKINYIYIMTVHPTILNLLRISLVLCNKNIVIILEKMNFTVYIVHIKIFAIVRDMTFKSLKLQLIRIKHYLWRYTSLMS